jgi:catechol 2,3-dioxygenase
MIETKGLTHLHLMVSDLQRSLNFYQSVFGLQIRFWADKTLVFLNTPGANDMIALHLAKPGETTGESGGITHFGFELKDRADLDRAIEAVVAAGGSFKKRGEFTPGFPFAYVSDPDGYEIEL